MILSVSRRTDIPAFYSDWFFNRVKKGEVMIRNPVEPNLIYKIPINPDTTDGIVFWSKNPKPMLDKLDLIKDYPYYFQFTINSYRTDIERNVPRKAEIIDTFKRLSDKIGPERVLWRYDPVLISDKLGYNLDYHVTYFDKLASILHDYTSQCTFSFVDMYSYISKYTAKNEIRGLSENEMDWLAGNFAEIAKPYNLPLKTCAESIDLTQHCIEHGRCIDADLLSKIGGINLSSRKDPSQRKECGCVKSVDIGSYNTCQNGCLYCYATLGGMTTKRLDLLNNSDYPMLLDLPGFNDRIVPMKVESIRINYGSSLGNKRKKESTNNNDDDCEQLSFI